MDVPMSTDQEKAFEAKCKEVLGKAIDDDESFANLELSWISPEMDEASRHPFHSYMMFAPMEDGQPRSKAGQTINRIYADLVSWAQEKGVDISFGGRDGGSYVSIHREGDEN